jgi:hypothetical protein
MWRRNHSLNSTDSRSGHTFLFLHGSVEESGCGAVTPVVPEAEWILKRPLGGINAPIDWVCTVWGAVWVKKVSRTGTGEWQVNDSQ